MLKLIQLNKNKVYVSHSRCFTLGRYNISCNSLASSYSVQLRLKKKYDYEIVFFFKHFMYVGRYLFVCLFVYFREKERKGERERNINVWLPLTQPQPGTWPATQACALTGNQTGDPLVHRPVLNPLSHTIQGMSFKLLARNYITIFFCHQRRVFFHFLKKNEKFPLHIIFSQHLTWTLMA